MGVAIKSVGVSKPKFKTQKKNLKEYLILSTVVIATSIIIK